jgi:hypothetical protein
VPKTNDSHGRNKDVSRLDHLRRQLGARRIEFISAAVIGVVFAVCFAHLEYTTCIVMNKILKSRSSDDNYVPPC